MIAPVQPVDCLWKGCRIVMEALHTSQPMLRQTSTQEAAMLVGSEYINGPWGACSIQTVSGVILN